jgi:hypothetical protein
MSQRTMTLKWSQIFFFSENLQKSVGPASVLLLEDVDNLLGGPPISNINNRRRNTAVRIDKSGGTQHPTLNVHHYFAV